MPRGLDAGGVVDERLRSAVLTVAVLIVAVLIVAVLIVAVMSNE